MRPPTARGPSASGRSVRSVHPCSVPRPPARSSSRARPALRARFRPRAHARTRPFSHLRPHRPRLGGGALGTAQQQPADGGHRGEAQRRGDRAADGRAVHGEDHRDQQTAQRRPADHLARRISRRRPRGVRDGLPARLSVRSAGPLRTTARRPVRRRPGSRFHGPLRERPGVGHGESAARRIRLVRRRGRAQRLTRVATWSVRSGLSGR